MVSRKKLAGVMGSRRISRISQRGPNRNWRFEIGGRQLIARSGTDFSLLFSALRSDAEYFYGSAPEAANNRHGSLLFQAPHSVIQEIKP
jgi:hypothetical protein